MSTGNTLSSLEISKPTLVRNEEEKRKALDIRILTMVQGGKSLAHVSRELNLKYARCYYVFIRHGLSVKQIKSVNIDVITVGRENSDSREPHMVDLLEHGSSLLEIREPKKCSIKVTSEELQRHERLLRYRAFVAGLSVYRYLRLRSLIGKQRFAFLRVVMTNYEKNKKLLKNFGDQPLFQMSVEELFHVYLMGGKKFFPDLLPLDAFDALTKRRSGYMLSRYNWSLPCTVDNLHVVTKKEFGYTLGKKRSARQKNK